MRTATILVSAILLICIQFSAVGAESPAATVDSSTLAVLQFPSAGNSTQHKYLGISSGDSLSLGQITAERLIVVVFNAYCTICQADAPVLKFLYGSIEDDPGLKGRTKIVGIAAGNTQMEVDNFRNEHKVPFPLFPDPNFSVDRAIPSHLRVPIIIIASNNPGRPLEILKIHQGELKDVDGLLERPSQGTARIGVLMDSRPAKLALE